MSTFRIKNEDGTWDKVPVLGSYQAVLAANEAATNAQNAANSVQKYKALWFDSVASMRAEPSLTAGAYVNTAGYYEPNDGGGASYLIRAKTDADVDDRGSIHELQNGLVAELIVENGTVCPEQFGAKGNGVTDDTDAFQKALNTGYVITLFGKYKITNALASNNKNIVWRGANRAKILLDVSDVFLSLNSKIICVENVTFEGVCDTIFELLSCKAKFQHCDFNCGSLYSIKCSPVESTLKQETIISKCSFNSAYGVYAYGDEEKSVFILNDNNFYCSTSPYYIANHKIAHVIGGIYVGTEGVGNPNLYNCHDSQIIGGHYSNMNRGATLGGPRGEKGRIIGTLCENMTDYCIGVDWRSNETDAEGNLVYYSDGKAIVSNNICINGGCGMWVQTKDIVIANNTIYSGELSLKTDGHIRINCDYAVAKDCNIVVCNNVVDCTATPTVYPIELGSNTVANIYNNKIKSEAIRAVNGNPNSLAFAKKIHYFSEDKTELDFLMYDIFVYDGANNASCYPIGNPNKNIDFNGYIFTIINNSEYTLTISSKYEGVTFIGNLTMPAKSMSRITFLSNALRFVESATFN